MKTFPTLYYKGKDGKLRQWRCWADGKFVYVEHGCVGGTLQTSVGAECQATNVGRANYRDESGQAESEAESLHTHKLERRYRLSKDEANLDLFLPMLAHSWDGQVLDYPCDVQPKFDGVRCMAYWCGEEIALMSRSGKPYSVPHIEAELRLLLPKDKIFDGELYCHGKSCQQITSLVKGYREESIQLLYCVYDIPNKEQTWEERVQELYTFEDSTFIKFVATLRVAEESLVKVFEERFVKEGFEGAIVRCLEGKYEFGRRSNHLLKVKTFQDAEFKVIDYYSGKGAYADCCVFRCRNDINDREFDVNAPGSIDEKCQYLIAAPSFIGTKLTVKFFGRTDDGLPRFPVGKCFRDKKDLAK